MRRTLVQSGCCGVGFAKVALALLAVLCLLPLQAQQLDDPTLDLEARNAPRESVDGVSGLVISAVSSNFGEEFFRNFNEYWREKPSVEKLTLTIIERPSKRFGNQILVMFGQKQLFNGRLPNKFGQVRSLSEQAADMTYESIISLNLFAASAVEIDLGGDEI